MRNFVFLVVPYCLPKRSTLQLYGYDTSELSIEYSMHE